MRPAISVASVFTISQSELNGLGVQDFSRLQISEVAGMSDQPDDPLGVAKALATAWPSKLVKRSRFSGIPNWP